MRYLMILMLALGLASCEDKTPDSPMQQAVQAWVGKDFSGIEVQTLDGEKQPLKDAFLLDGKPVIINVWATWCTPCLEEMPALDALGKQGQYKVLAIATDKDTQTVRDFLKQQNWGSGMTVLFDRLGSVTRAQMGAVGMPVSYVLDPSLTVKMAEAGERDWTHPRMIGKIMKALQE